MHRQWLGHECLNMLFSHNALSTRIPPQSVTPPRAASACDNLVGQLSAECIPQMDTLTDGELETQNALVLMTDSAPDELTAAISQAQPEEQVIFIPLLKHYYGHRVNKVHSEPILDS